MSDAIELSHIDVALPLLLLLAALGGFDTLINHNMRARLPARAGAAPELRLHAARELLYGLLFIGLAVADWVGWWSLAPVLLLIAIVVIDTADVIVEPGVRQIDALERVVHSWVWAGIGAFAVALAATVVVDWWPGPSMVLPVYRGWITVVLALAGAAALVVGVGDALAARRRSLDRRTPADPTDTHAKASV